MNRLLIKNILKSNGNYLKSTLQPIKKVLKTDQLGFLIRIKLLKAK